MRLKTLLATIPALLVMTAALAQPPAPQTKITDVLVMVNAKPGVTPEQIRKVMPEEVRATVRLYLDGKIRQWYTRSDGKGVLLILDCKDVAEAQSLMNSLPLSREQLVDFEYIPMSPLTPLGVLLGPPAPAK